MTALKEKRHTYRKPYDVSITYSDSTTLYRDKISDISTGGMLIHTDRLIPPGQIVRITIPLPRQNYITVPGEVIRKNPEGLAIRFKPESPYTSKMIHRFVDTLGVK